MGQKCVHKGCGKEFTDPDEPCVYHPGPPEFHEGAKGWKCCKPRVLNFDEFLVIPPCTTGKHSTVDDTPVEPAKPAPPPELSSQQESAAPVPKFEPIYPLPTTLSESGAHEPTPTGAPPLPAESESDDPSLEIPTTATCRRRGCEAKYNPTTPRDQETCTHHPGQPIFHEGSKGWSCCKRRVLEFDEFLKIKGCKDKTRHLFIGNGDKGGEEKVEEVRTDFYQTASTVIVSLYLKKIEKDNAKVKFSTQNIEFDLPTSDNKRYKELFPLFAPIDPEKSSYRILGTKMELSLAKADGASWPVLRSDERRTGEIIQVGRPKRA
ncbi:hypothetical protein AJ80_03204 [Polytolypa hystricis UAMH7299]|uniref:CORD and CS domain-containing protein n=1 Tax=Polytolypa hystricis (strain UAMH7299) TaxID=1447883 RepID=A0A2B7YIZ4_POLH7|nr:hypothetical protein AJ80_03204 [Polytolypa hystricis UAMH7299]